MNIYTGFAADGRSLALSATRHTAQFPKSTVPGAIMPDLICNNSINNIYIYIYTHIHIHIYIYIPASQTLNRWVPGNRKQPTHAKHCLLQAQSRFVLQRLEQNNASRKNNLI